MSEEEIKEQNSKDPSPPPANQPGETAGTTPMDQNADQPTQEPPFETSDQKETPPPTEEPSEGESLPAGGREEKPSEEASPEDEKDEEGARIVKGSYLLKPALTQEKEAKWYVVHTQSGHEKKVAETLRQRVESLELKEKIPEILIPTQEKVVVSAGKKKNVRERLFPGYVLIKMVMGNETWAIVRNTSGVTGFVGFGTKPAPLSPREIEGILKFMELGAPKFEAAFKVGETVKVIDGPFTDFLGKVDALDEEKGKVRVLVSIFGRETPVELDFLQVSRL